MEGAMPKWLVYVLIWGGAALAILFAIALILVKVVAPTPAPGAMPGSSAAPATLYWILLVVGSVAAVVGLVLGRRKT